MSKTICFGTTGRWMQFASRGKESSCKGTRDDASADRDKGCGRGGINCFFQVLSNTGNLMWRSKPPMNPQSEVTLSRLFSPDTKPPSNHPRYLVPTPQASSSPHPSHSPPHHPRYLTSREQSVKSQAQRTHLYSLKLTKVHL